ncbi:MAG: hypothetical protein IKH59_05535 [Bacteroidaceae bacterium]|nr:hypothetical protein [Bacteroidaceae bacterium]
MANINFSDFWKNFASDFIKVQEGNITVEDEVKDYHPIVQRGLCKLGWTYEQDLFHHFSLGRKNERPDFFIKYDDSLKHNQGVPVEVKLPNNVMDEENREQLVEYMRLSDSNIGIYIGEHVRVFYRPSLEKDLEIVIDAAFANEDLAGVVFAELFFSATFNIESLKAELNKYYELERLIDEKRLSDFDNSIVPEGWLVDRYNKRAQIQQLLSTNGMGKKNKSQTPKQTPYNRISINPTGIEMCSSAKPESSIGMEHDFNACNQRSIRLPNPEIPYYEYQLIGQYRNNYPNMTNQDWAELAFVEKLHHDNMIPDDYFVDRVTEIRHRPPRGQRKGTKTSRN